MPLKEELSLIKLGIWVPHAAVTLKAFTNFLSQDDHIIHCLFAEELVTRNGGC